ncbi:MAG TPA: phosphotransferase [Pseudonocardiaceae bacterium]|nr:phosphotransferase [Pseudonocardiaceae bacterium]
MTDELPLPGGFIAAPVRLGDTVRRPLGPRASFVHALLRHFDRAGWSGAPRLLGIDDAGREILSYVEGHVPWRSPLEVGSAVVAVARLLRECHDLTAGTALAGDQEVVCHNDLSPRNTVYRREAGEWRPVVFLDWDIAAPGERVHDVAHLCWQFLPLDPRATDVADTALRLRAVADAYGLADRSALVPTVLWWQDRCWRGIEAGAAAGEQNMLRLRETGAAADVRAAHAWVTRHRTTLERALR